MPSREIAGAICARAKVFVPVICILFLVCQMLTLDYYLVIGFDDNLLWWLWVIPDAIAIGVFIMAFVTSFRFLSRPVSHRPGKASIGGELPLGYVAWGVYSVFLATKVAITFINFAYKLDEEDFYGPNTLKTTIALASPIFLLLVMAHHDAEENSNRHFYIDIMIGGVSMDILDTVAFLDVLFIQESKIFLSFSMHYTIVAVSVINLILPTLPLLILSRTLFGRGYLPRLLYTIHLTVYLCVINTPMLVIRLLLWHVHSENISVFLMKNVMGLGLAIKKIHASAVKTFSDAVDGNPNEEGTRLQKKGEHSQEIEMQVQARGNDPEQAQPPTTEL